MEIEEAIETIMNMMIEHPNTNSGRAVRDVFDALLRRAWDMIATVKMVRVDLLVC